MSRPSEDGTLMDYFLKAGFKVEAFVDEGQKSNSNPEDGICCYYSKNTDTVYFDLMDAAATMFDSNTDTEKMVISAKTLASGPKVSRF